MVFVGHAALATDTDAGTAINSLGGGHVGYVAGRYRSGVWSDHWTDVSRCAGQTFTHYAPGLRAWLARDRPAGHQDGHDLKLVEATGFENGLALLRYEIKK